MANYELDELRGFEWMQNRIPAGDALTHFVPDGPRDAEVDSLGMDLRGCAGISVPPASRA